ncbi:MAG TPA: IgGFc-binding protein [Polyangia bacterium]|nr:IgGFc-binding protein [Polyangia bacterium]
MTLLIGAVAAAFCLAGAGCTAAAEGPGDDAGDAGSGGDGATVPACTGTRVCDGDRVRACDGATVGALLQVCDEGQLCSAGSCITESCAAAARAQSLSGCLFYGALADNIDRDDAMTSSLILVNPGGVPANATLLSHADGSGWSIIQSAMVPVLGAERFIVPNLHQEDVGVARGLGFRLESDQPIFATLIESDDSTEMSESSGGTMLLPNHALGTEYMVMTYPQLPLPAISAAAGSHDGAGEVTIVATADGTEVTVRLSSTASMAAGGVVPDLGPGQMFSAVLDDGDVLALRSRDDATDLSGTVIDTNQPVVVIAGNVYTTYGRAAPGINSPDLAMEEMLPVANWGQSYVAARLGPQKDTCDSLFGGGSSLWRILAAGDDTHVTFEAPLGLGGGLPSGELVLAAGEVREILVTSAGSFHIKATKPILATQGMDCEATLSAGVSTSSLWHDFIFALPANFDHELLVIRPDTGTISLDGKPIDEALFQPAGGVYEAARISIPPCVGHPRNCLHHLEGTFGLTWRGMDVVCGYALTPFTWTRCMPGDPDCIP